MAPSADMSGDESEDSQVEWEREQGIPQMEDPFIQKYMAGRQALIEEEKKQRHDRVFKQSMSPMAKQAAKIMASIRRRESQTIWTSEFEDSLADKNGGNLYPGMMFTLARDRMETTDLWKIIEKMPKGALLHAHLDAMIDIDWLVDQALAEKGFCMLAPEGLTDKDKRTSSPLQIRYYPDEEIKKQKNPASIWTTAYVSETPVPIREAQRTFPDDETTFKKWLISRCTVTAEESLCHHHGLDAIWRKFQSTFRVITWMFTYEPIFRRALQRLLGQLAHDGINYVDFRIAFVFEFRKQGQTTGQNRQVRRFLQSAG